MQAATATSDAVDEDLRMGSEYASARTYLSQVPRSGTAVRKAKQAPQHGLNDSDFGALDQQPD